MNPLIDDLVKKSPVEYAGYINSLKDIFQGMQNDYQAAADVYPFCCKGCEDSCCRTRFYHHTLLEYVYLLAGYRHLDRDTRGDIQIRAQQACEELQATDVQDVREKRMCPVNFNGLCGLYDCRPMICRLHGIPHELHRPGCDISYGPGCDEFTRLCGQAGYHKFDRTPHYFAMAELENKFKKELGFTGKIKMTIAEMIVTFQD